MPHYIFQPYSNDSIGSILQRELANLDWTEFNCLVAFIKTSGTKYLTSEVADFIARGGTARIVAGVDCLGTSREGLESLLHVLTGKSQLWVFHSEANPTFHPKVYAFSNQEAARVVIGSGNLTEGGLFTNYEAAIIDDLKLTDAVGRSQFAALTDFIRNSTDPATKLAIRVDLATAAKLYDRGYVCLEAAGSERNEPRSSGVRRGAVLERMFAAKFIPPPLIKGPRPARRPRRTKAIAIAAVASRAANAGFVMTLQQTDVGLGQTTKGTSRRSPEIFIPLAARDFDMGFWDWPRAFSEDPGKADKFDRPNVPFLIGATPTTVNMMTWPDKSDFRLRSEVLRSAGLVGDVLVIERTEDETVPHRYAARVIGKKDHDYGKFLALCTNKTRNSKKLWGYY